MKPRRSPRFSLRAWPLACVVAAAGAATALGAAGCFQELDPNAATGPGLTDDDSAAPPDFDAETSWQLCQSPSCDLPNGNIPFLAQTPLIYQADGSTTLDPCNEVWQAAMTVRQTYCASCHQAPADQAGMNFVLDDSQLATAHSQSAVTDAGLPQPLIVPGSPRQSWLYVRVAQGMGGAQGGMPPLAMPGYPAIPRPSAADLSLLYGWVLACFPGTDGGAYVQGGGNYGAGSDAGAAAPPIGEDGGAGEGGDDGGPAGD